MCQHRSDHSTHHSHTDEHHHHHDDPASDHHHHHHDLPQGAGSEFSARQKLVVRLEHAMRHNREHVVFYEKLAEEAGRLEGDTVAQEIRVVARSAVRQNEHLQKALSLIQPR